MDRYNPRGRHGGGMHIEKIYDNSKVPTDCPYYWSDDSVCGNVKSDRYLRVCKFACKEWKKMSEETDVSQNCKVEPEKKQRVSSKVSSSSKQNQQKKIQQLTLAVAVERRQREAAETIYHNSEKEIMALRKTLQNEKIQLNDKEVRIEILQQKLQAIENILADKEQQINVLQKNCQTLQQQLNEEACDEDIALNKINNDDDNDSQNKIGMVLTIFLIIIIIVMVKLTV